MLIIDKTDDIQTLKNLGANNALIRLIFLFEGWLISVTGAVCGIVTGVLLCLAQQYLGIIRMGDGYVVDNYPVILHFSDVLMVFLAVLILGCITAYYPARYAAKKDV